MLDMDANVSCKWQWGMSHRESLTPASSWQSAYAVLSAIPRARESLVFGVVESNAVLLLQVLLHHSVLYLVANLQSPLTLNSRNLFETNETSLHSDENTNVIIVTTLF